MEVNIMAVSEARKRANIKWSKNNMKRISVNVRKEKAELFQELTKKNGTNPSALFKQLIDDYIKINDVTP